MQLSLEFNQRWNRGRTSYRPPDELIRPRDYDVAELSESSARAFVVAHHYSRSVPAMRFRVGLYRHGALVGVAVFSHPCSDAVLTNTFPSVPVRHAVELGRFVLLDSEPGNAETFFLARAFDVIRSHGIEGVVSFSDPMPRTDVSGAVHFLGHTGTIYQAFNGCYLGRGTARTLRLLPDGRAFNDRAIQKIRKAERGWVAAAAILEQFGATRAPTEVEPRITWLQNSLSTFTRAVRHRGCHKYAWALTRAVRRTLAPSLPFPKVLDAAG